MVYEPGDRIEWVSYWATISGEVVDVVRYTNGSIQGYKVRPDGCTDIVFVDEDTIITHTDRHNKDPKDLMSDYDRAMGIV